jgi:ribosome maturation factor RimP
MNLRTLTACTLTLTLFHLSLPAKTMDVKQRVELFGVGTDLKVKLKDGEKLRGSIESIRDSSVVMALQGDGAKREIGFDALETVSYPSRGYKANGTPDAAAARRMVVQLGVGEHIMVQVSPKEKIRGHIAAIHHDHFVIAPDGKTTPVTVDYSTIHKVNKNLSFGATIAILVGIAAAVVLILVLSGEEDVDVLPN